MRQRELRGAQDYLAGNFPLTIETPNAIATQVLEAVLFGLDLGELETYPDRIRSVSPSDIQRVARNFLQPEHLAIVLVGDASSFVDDLEGVGFGRTLDLLRVHGRVGQLVIEPRGSWCWSHPRPPQ